MGWPGENLVIKLCDIFEKGVGAAFRPRQIFREEAARREARRLDLLVAAQTMNDAEEIRARRKTITQDGKLIALSAPDSKPLIQVADSLEVEWSAVETIKADEAAKRLSSMANLTKIAVFAEEEAERIGDENMSSDDIEPDWFTHWRSHAEKASRDDLQRLWARVLAGEAKKPNSYSFRTLDFLSVMTKEDAAAIEQLAQYIFCNDSIAMELGEFYQAEGFTFSDRLHLAAIGMVTDAGSLMGPQKTLDTTHFNGEDYVVIKSNGAALVLFSDAPKQIKVPISPLTHMGLEVLKFVDAKPNEKYLRALAMKLAGKDFSKAAIGRTDIVSGKITDVRDIPIS